MPNDTPGVTTSSTGGSTVGVSGTAAGGNAADTLSQTAAALAAAATSLSENMAKFASLTESVQKSIDNAGVNSQHEVDTSVSETVVGVKVPEAISSFVARMVGDSLDFKRQVDAIAARALNNAAETDNMVGKQAVRHADTQLYQTALVQNATLVNDLLAGMASLSSSLKAAAQQLATPTATTGATKSA